MLLNVDIQVVTPNKAKEHMEEEIIKVVEVEEVDQGLKVPDIDVV